MGEDDKATSKASTVLNAITGYSPLIYELVADCKYSEFIRLCEKVWSSMQGKAATGVEAERQSLTQDMVHYTCLVLICGY